MQKPETAPSGNQAGKKLKKRAPTRQKPQIESIQPTVEQLKELGIKVRDFGYESTLPPIPPFRRAPPPVPHVYNQGDPRFNAKRHCGPTRGLERTPTEPELTPDTLVVPQPQLEGVPGIKRTGAQFDLLGLKRTPTEPELNPDALIVPQPQSEGAPGIKRAGAQS